MLISGVPTRGSPGPNSLGHRISNNSCPHAYKTTISAKNPITIQSYLEKKRISPVLFCNQKWNPPNFLESKIESGRNPALFFSIQIDSGRFFWNPKQNQIASYRNHEDFLYSKIELSYMFNKTQIENSVSFPFNQKWNPVGSLWFLGNKGSKGCCPIGTTGSSTSQR